MANQSVWYFTGLPNDIIKNIESDLHTHYGNQMKDSRLIGHEINKVKRDSKNTWIPTDHWVAGWLWHFIQKANRTNFLYDLNHIDAENMQYTQYGEGMFYGWHNDAGIASAYKPQVTIDALHTQSNEDYLRERTVIQHELIRKLSFTLQLSGPDDYEGGNVQFLDENNKSYIAPRQQGTLIVFDSRTQHRVCKVTKGTRKSIVGWVVGPRWK